MIVSLKNLGSDAWRIFLKLGILGSMHYSDAEMELFLMVWIACRNSFTQITNKANFLLFPDV